MALEHLELEREEALEHSDTPLIPCEDGSHTSGPMLHRRLCCPGFGTRDPVGLGGLGGMLFGGLGRLGNSEFPRSTPLPN